MEHARHEALGRLLAERHASSVDAGPVHPAPEQSVLNYAESARVGDWSMRSALVRFAQPEPVRAGELLEQVALL